jgi:hypothetical protein
MCKLCEEADAIAVQITSTTTNKRAIYDACVDILKGARKENANLSKLVPWHHLSGGGSLQDALHEGDPGAELLIPQFRIAMEKISSLLVS